MDNHSTRPMQSLIPNRLLWPEGAITMTVTREPMPVGEGFKTQFHAADGRLLRQDYHVCADTPPALDGVAGTLPMAAA